MIVIDDSITTNTKSYFYDAERDIFSAPEIKIGFFEPTHEFIVDAALSAASLDLAMDGKIRGIRLKKHLDKAEASWDRLSKKIDDLHDEMMGIIDNGGCCMYKKLCELQKKQYKFERLRESISDKSRKATDLIMGFNT